MIGETLAHILFKIIQFLSKQKDHATSSSSTEKLIMGSSTVPVH